MDDERVEGNIMKRKRPDVCDSQDHLITQTNKHKDVGNPDSDNIVLSSPCLARLSVKDVEQICNRRMQKLLLKQIRKVNVFTRTERERMASLKQKHSLDRQRYQELIRHEEVENLDDIFKQKVKEHNDLMDMKWKELHNQHMASIKKVKEWEGRTTNYLMKMNLNEPISLSASTEKGVIDVSFQNSNSGSPIDNAPVDTEVLVIESDGEDDVASIPRVARTNGSENGASYSAASHCERQSASNRETDWNSSKNMGSSLKSLRGVVGDHPSESNSRFLESDGENDMMVMTSGEHDGSTEPLYDVSDEGTLEKNEVLSKQNDEETLVNIPATEVGDGNSNMEGASVGAPSREGSSLEKRDTTSANMPDMTSPNAEASNKEAEDRDAENLNTTFPQLNVENVPELPSSTSASGGSGVMQVIPSTISGNLSPSGLPVHSTNLAFNQITQTAAGFAIPSCEIPMTSSFCLPSQISEQLVNIGPRQWPMVQNSIMGPPLPSVLGQVRPYVSSCTTIPRPATINYFLGNSSSMPSTRLLTGSDPLRNELVRVEKEKEDVSKSHETEMKSLRIAMDKEFEEISKKYDLLLQDTEKAFLMKKRDLESFKEKVCKHKLLADTLQICHSQEPSKEDLPNALNQLSILLHHTSEQSTLPNTRRSVQPLQVHQLSDLFLDDQGSTRPFMGTQNHQIVAPPRPQGPIPFLDMQNQRILAPPLPQGSRPFLGTQNQRILAPPLPQGSRPFLGMQNQRILAPPPPQGTRPFLSTQNQQMPAPPRPLGPLPGLNQRAYAPGHRTVHLDGSRDNPVQLS